MPKQPVCDNVELLVVHQARSFHVEIATAMLVAAPTSRIQTPVPRTLHFDCMLRGCGQETALAETSRDREGTTETAKPKNSKECASMRVCRLVGVVNATTTLATR